MQTSCPAREEAFNYALIVVSDFPVTKACERLVQKGVSRNHWHRKKGIVTKGRTLIHGRHLQRRGWFLCLDFWYTDVMRKDNARKMIKRGTKPFYHDLPHECLPTIHLMDSLFPHLPKFLPLSLFPCHLCLHPRPLAFSDGRGLVRRCHEMSFLKRYVLVMRIRGHRNVQ